MSENNYQYSIKLETGEIYVCTAASLNDFLTRMGEIKKLTSFSNTNPIVENPVTTANQLSCDNCGGPAKVIDGVSKKGNPYKIFKCKNFPELVSRNGHSHYIN